MIVQQILAAGGPGMELAARNTISITRELPWGMGLQDTVTMWLFLGSLHCKRWPQ